MKFAIIGAGFSGLAIAWHLVQHSHHSVHVYDAVPIGKGTSGMAAGLLHTYAGLHAKMNWKGAEGYAATHELLALASHEIEKPVAYPSGLLRMVLNEENQRDYAQCAQKYPDVTWWTEQECQRRVPGLAKKPGIFIENCLTVDAENYLKGLWQACHKKGGHFHCKNIQSLDELNDFDIVILATGAATSGYPEARHLPLTFLKGQILVLEWPSELPPLAIPLNSQAYILMEPGNKTCLVGATFERHFENSEPQLTVAAQELIPKAAAMLPALGKAKILACKAGIRVSAPNHVPLAEQINERCWVLTGMGSKGLLYHALFAKQLVLKILSA